MQNIKMIINNHDMNILHQINKIKDDCIYRNKKYCPLGGKCLFPNIVYQEEITSSQPNHTVKNYFRVAENPSKINHTKSCNHENYANDTELLKDCWEIKSSNFIRNISRSNLRKCLPYNLSKESATCV